MKGAGMLFVLLRGVNFGCWSHLGCSEQNAMKFSRQGRNNKTHIFLISFIYSFRGQKSLDNVQIGLLQNFQ